MHTPKAEERMRIHAIIRILEDRYPHAVSELELASLLNLPEENVDSLLGFLAKYSFIAYDEEEKKAIITPEFSMLD